MIMLWLSKSQCEENNKVTSDAVGDGLMLYRHDNQPRSCLDGQLAKPHFSWAGLISGFFRQAGFF